MLTVLVFLSFLCCFFVVRDGACQETGKHVFYQIQGNKVVNCGWNAPPPPQQVDASAKGSSSSSSASSSEAAPVAFNK